MNSNQNSLPDLIEVLMRVVNSNEEDHRDVRVELRVNSVSLVADDCLEFVVELDRANLSLDLDGFEVVPKSRYGEPTKSNDVAIERKLTNETVLQGEVSASLEGTVSSVPSGSFSGKVSGSAGTRSTESTSAQQTQNLLRVKARGNLRWEISEPTLQGSSAALADSYLVDDVLCKISAALFLMRQTLPIRFFRTRFRNINTSVITRTTLIWLKGSQGITGQTPSCKLREGNCSRRLRRCRMIGRIGTIEAEGNNCDKVIWMGAG
jgi:hypothetical protein